jgi:propanol-preferring alcohol dehydrogenase
MHAEFFTIPASACHLLPDGLDWETGVLISGDGFGVPYHTATRIDSLDRSVGGNGGDTETVAIFGLGPIGLGNLLMQRHRSRRVIGIDRAPARLELASMLGAEATIPATTGQDLVEMARRHTDGRGVDIAIEAAGVPETARQCFRVVRRGGLVVFNGEQAEVPLSPSEDFIRRDVTAMGSWFYHFREFPEMLALVRSGLPVSSLITHRFPVAAASDAYGAFAEGKTGKVLLTYDTT